MARQFNRSAGMARIAHLRILALIVAISIICYWLYSVYFFHAPVHQVVNDRYFPSAGKVVFNPDEMKLSLVAPEEVAPILEFALSHLKTTVELRPHYAVTTDNTKNLHLADFADQRGQLVQGLMIAGGLPQERVHLNPSRPTENILPSDPEARRVDIALDDTKKADADLTPPASLVSSAK